MLIDESLEKPVFWGPLLAHNVFIAKVAATTRKNKLKSSSSIVIEKIKIKSATQLL